MTVFSPSPLRSLGLGAAMAFGMGGGGALADQVHVHYGISLIGLPIGSALIAGAVEPASYKLEMSAKLTGLASVLSSSRGAATATGAVTGGGHVAPATYANTTANSTTTRTIRIAMNAGTVSGIDIAPPWNPDLKRVPITEADQRNILDPLSAFVMSVPAGTPAGSPVACNRTLPIFDGGVRFNIELSFVGTRHVSVKGYDGDAAVCQARYVPVSGQLVDSRSSRFMAENRNLEVSLIPMGGLRVVFPYRISVRTMVGTVVVEADDVGLQGSRASTQ